MISQLGNAGKFPVLLAFSFAVVVSLQGFGAASVLRAKAASQEVVTEGVHRWKQSYLALRETLDKWESSYRRDDSIQDLVSLYAMIGLEGYELKTNTDAVILNKVEPLTQNNMHIGLTKFCLISTKGGDAGALSVQAPNYETLFEGLNKLAARPDIHIGTISIKGGSSVAMASLGDFCALLRSSKS